MGFVQRVLSVVPANLLHSRAHQWDGTTDRTLCNTLQYRPSSEGPVIPPEHRIAAIRVGKRCATTEDRSPGPPRSASECLGLAGSGNELEVAQVAVVFGVVCNQWRGQNQSGGGDPRIGCAHLAPFPHALVSNLSPGRTQQIVRIQAYLADFSVLNSNTADCPNSGLKNPRDMPPASPTCVVPNSRPAHLGAFPPMS